MKIALLFLLVFIGSSVKSQVSDTIIFSIDTSAYNRVAREKLDSIFDVEKHSEKDWYTHLLLSSTYDAHELQTWSIPVFTLNQQAKNYKCGDNLELLLEFKQDPYFQCVFLSYNQKQVGGIDILDSFREANRIKDSIENNSYSIHGNPIMDDLYNSWRRTEKKIVRYKQKNKDAFIFIIKDIRGFWVVKDGRLCKLLGMTEKSANRYIAMYYGEELIHDLADEGMRTGYPYYSCGRIKKRWKDIFVKIEYK